MRQGTEFLRETIGRNSRYLPKQFTPQQLLFLSLPCKEAMYGGAAGGGKSWALLAAATQFVHIPGYSAILFRRTYPQLKKPGGLIPTAEQWFGGTDAHWRGDDYQWVFPSGATINFGFMEHEKSKWIYQGAAFQFIGFDELTHFQESQYRYLFSRLRRPDGCADPLLASVPLRMRSGANPGGVGHKWVHNRFFVEGAAKGRIFIPAKLEDNPLIDKEAYEETLAELDPVTRQQLRYGDWNIQPDGNLFKREWFGDVVERSAVPRLVSQVRYWDFAASEKKRKKGDPDWTSGGHVAEGADGLFYIMDMVHFRGTPRAVEKVVKGTAVRDGYEVPIWIEEEGGSAGLIVLDHYRRDVLKGWEVHGDRPTTSKVVRSGPFSAACEAGNVRLVRGAWNGDFIDELCAFPTGDHDDQVDAASGGFAKVTRRAREWTKSDWAKAIRPTGAPRQPRDLLMEKLRGLRGVAVKRPNQ